MFVVADVHTQRHDAAGADAALQTGEELLLRERTRLEELLHERIVGFRDHLDQRVTRRLGGALQLRRHRRLGRLAAAVGRKRVHFHRDEIDDSAKGFFFANRNLNRNHRAAKDRAQRVECARHAGPLAIEPVQDHDLRRFHLLGHRPDFFGRDLGARDRIDDHEGRIRHAQRRARVAQKVRHARRVDEVDLRLVPLDVGEAGGECVLAGDFFLVEIGHRRAFVDATEAVDGTGVEQQRREQLRLAGAAMADQRDIPHALSVVDLHRQSPR